MNRYYVIDTETTCATPERGVCDIAILELDSDMVIVARHESLIDPQRPIHPEASAVHGLSNSDVADAPTMAEYFSDVAPQCFGGLLQGPAVLIGHNVRFDTHTIGPYVQGSYVELDTLRWFRHLYPQAENHKLQTAVQARGLPQPDNAHRAMDDVLTTLDLLKHILLVTGKTLPELALASRAPLPMTVMPFGKHKGTPLAKLPGHYKKWLLNNVEDPDLLFALQ